MTPRDIHSSQMNVIQLVPTIGIIYCHVLFRPARITSQIRNYPVALPQEIIRPRYRTFKLFQRQMPYLSRLRHSTIQTLKSKIVSSAPPCHAIASQRRRMRELSFLQRAAQPSHACRFLAPASPCTPPGPSKPPTLLPRMRDSALPESGHAFQYKHDILLRGLRALSGEIFCFSASLRHCVRYSSA